LGGFLTQSSICAGENLGDDQRVICLLITIPAKVDKLGQGSVREIATSEKSIYRTIGHATKGDSPVGV
jgi:hypothetical protein